MDNKSVFAANLKRLMQKEGKTRKDVCDALGFNYYTFADWVTGRKYPRMNKVEALAEYFGVSKSELIEERPTNILLENIIALPTTHKVPLIGTIACGKPILAVEEASEKIDIPDFVHADFALRCKGDSMITARIFDGDVVYIRQQDTVENGEIAAVVVGDEATLKKVYYQPGERLILRACNPMYPDLEYFGSELNEIKILGKAVSFVSNVRG